MAHLGSDFFCSPSPQPTEVVRGRWSEVARTTGITTSAQTRVKRGGDDESRCRRLETKMTSEVTCLGRERRVLNAFQMTREARSILGMLGDF